MQRRNPAVDLRERRIPHGNYSVDPGQLRVELNGFVGQAHAFGRIPSVDSEKGEAFGVVILYGLLCKCFQFRIWRGAGKRSADVEDLMPLGEGNLEGLAKHGGEEKGAEKFSKRRAPCAKQSSPRSEPAS